MQSGLIVTVGVVLSFAFLLLALGPFGLISNVPSKMLYSIDDSYFLALYWDFVQVGILMSVGPSALAYFWPHTRKLLVTSVFILAILFVAVAQSEKPEFILGAVLEFLPLFAIGACVPFYASYALVRRSGPKHEQSTPN